MRVVRQTTKNGKTAWKRYSENHWRRRQKKARKKAAMRRTIFPSSIMRILQILWIKKRDGILSRIIHRPMGNKKIKPWVSFLDLNAATSMKGVKLIKNWKNKSCGNYSRKGKIKKWRTVLFIQRPTAKKKINTYLVKTRSKDSTTMRQKSETKETKE